MAWEWVSPTATAATGIAAVGFAYLTSKRGEDARGRESTSLRTHERELIVRRERLEMFAAYLGAVDAFETSLTEANRAMHYWHKEEHTNQDVLPEAVGKMVDRLYDMDKHYQAARLVGSTAVSDAGLIVHRDAVEAWSGIIEKDQGWRSMSGASREILTAAMRVDLGNVD